jgi:hypothetical protein
MVSGRTFGEIIHRAEPYERRGFRICAAAARAFLFRPQVGQMIGKFGQIAPHVPGRDSSPQQAFAKFIFTKFTEPASANRWNVGSW